jgi:hypothetical protein
MNRMPDDDDIARRLGEARAAVLATIPTVRSPRISRQGRAGVAIAAAAVAVLGLTGGAVAVIQATHEQVAYSVQCFAGASLGSASTTVTVPEATDRTTGAAGSRPTTDPVADCADAWRSGLIGQASPPADPNTADFPVPDLVACTLRDGVGAGFPRGDSRLDDKAFCAVLGLAPWHK